MTIIYNDDGTLLSNQKDIENEISEFYGNLMGKANENLVGIDIVSMREGSQLSADQRRVFGVSVTEIEIV